MQKRRERFQVLYYAVSFILSWEAFLLRVVNATVHMVTTTIAVATEMSAALLNSGTFGVEVADEVEVVVEVEVVLGDVDGLDESEKYTHP